MNGVIIQVPDARQFFLCLDSEASAGEVLVRHLSCSLWKVPDNWTPGMKPQYLVRHVSAVPLSRNSRAPNGPTTHWRSGTPKECICGSMGDQDNHPIPASAAASRIKALSARADTAHTDGDSRDTYTPAQAKADTAEAGAR